jgi:hypothetical protein
LAQGTERPSSVPSAPAAAHSATVATK